MKLIIRINFVVNIKKLICKLSIVRLKKTLTDFQIRNTFHIQEVILTWHLVQHQKSQIEHQYRIQCY